MGGTVGAESLGAGKGATFIVNLPLVTVDQTTSANQSEQPTLTDAEPTIIAPSLDGIKVLVVDDEADARELLMTMLGQYGADVTAVATAQEALQALPQLNPNVLVSDIGMPFEDGYTLIRKVRAMDAEQGGCIPAVALTAYASTSDRTQALLAGFQIHVPKPANAIELAVVVGQLTGRSVSAR
jgi:CheY-like chemotaxis protein